MVPEAQWTPRAEMRVLNTDLPRVDGPVKVTGRARYTHDVRLPRMVYARLVLYPYSRAQLAGVDLSAAEAVPGVVHVRRIDPDKTDLRYLGDDSAVAVVVAETPEAALDGARAVRVDAEPEGNPCVTPEQTLAPDAPQIGRRGNEREAGSRGDLEETEAAIAAADARVEATYTLPVQHHVCLETHGTVVDYRGDSATVYASTQMVTDSAGAFAGMLGLQRDQVEVVCEFMGGGFGSKFGPGLEGRVACELSKDLGRPVHLMLDRPQEFQMAGNRSGSLQEMVGAASRDGKLVALRTRADKYGGMGGGSLPTQPYIYGVEHARTDIRSVHTALDSNRAMRAPGHPQASFAMESMVDELAYAVGWDPLEFRKANLSDPVYHRQLDRVAAEVGWADHPHKTAPGAPGRALAVGIGFAVAQWGSGARPGCKCEVRIAPDGSVTSSMGIQDLGTGARTYVGAIVAEELGLPLSAVTTRIGNSTLPPSVGSGGSVTTGSAAPAVKHAAHLAREALEAKLKETYGVEPGGYTWRDGKVWVTGDPNRLSLAWREVCALLGGEEVVVLGEFQAHLRDGGIHGAQAAKVSVDCLTGQVKVLDMVQIQDQGIPLNRMAVRSQMNGGMVQALSYALFEQRIVDPDFGCLLSGNLEDYKIAGAKDMPNMRALIDDDDDRQAVMGMAEASCIAGHGAIANAVFNACGARVRDLPLTPDRVLAALERS